MGFSQQQENIMNTENPIQTIIDNTGNVWRYYSGSFWTVILYKGNKYLQAAPALIDGNIDINVGHNEINSCDVEECEQHHLDFVNSAFNTTFELRGATADNPIGYPSFG